jgi:hypothetical protein
MSKILHRRLLRPGAVVLLATFLPVVSTGCFGRFETVRKVYSFNQGVHPDKWVRWAVFVGMMIVPVYGSAALFDMIFANTVEFWSGKNPMAMVPGSTRTVAGPDGERARMTLRPDGAIDVLFEGRSGPESRLVLKREGKTLAAYDADGALVARVGDGPDGTPRLLAAGPALAAAR